MTNWLSAAMLSLISFGLWGLFTKLTIAHIDSKSALIFQTIGVAIVGIITLSLMNFKPEMNMKGLSYGLLTGFAYGIGCFFYFLAADKGKLMTVVALTALYPLITIALSYFLLRENINLKQCCGIGFALIAIYLMI
ncbi:MAG: transporter family transporter protein [uncultured bacterium]|nr:MAG: transporter family transporter protein [uncultured bacterium]